MFDLIKRSLFSLCLMVFAPVALADSYRYMHVSIDTPWLIFIFLMIAILLPFILMAFLYWKNAMRKNAEAEAEEN